MKKIFLLNLFAAVLITASVLKAQDTGFVVRPDSRVELLSIVFTLAGNPEYGNSASADYKKDVKEYFGKFSEHEVVLLAREYRKQYGISFDAVMGMALHIEYGKTLKPRIPFTSPSKLEKRWKPETAEKFLASLNKFKADTDFDTFIESHKAFYDSAAARLKNLIVNNVKLAWFDEFFGKRKSGIFILTPGLLTGGGNYGVNFQKPEDNIDELYSIISFPKVDTQGLPVFDPSVASIIIHEFCHSYVNHVVDKHAYSLQHAGETIFPYVSVKMAPQAYTNWKTVMYESLVRAGVNRYLLKHGTLKEAEADVKNNTGRAFYWIDELGKLFEKYEKGRGTYPDLDSFMPEIIQFFNNYAGNIKEKMAPVIKEREEKIKLMKEKGPKLLSSIPANGDMNVDPSINELVLEFDREMGTNSYSFLLGSLPFPSVTGKPEFENGNKTLKLKISLKPNTEYEIWLNRDDTLGFKSSDNIPLYPVQIIFKTK